MLSSSQYWAFCNSTDPFLNLKWGSLKHLLQTITWVAAQGKCSSVSAFGNYAATRKGISKTCCKVYFNLIAQNALAH